MTGGLGPLAAPVRPQCMQVVGEHLHADRCGGPDPPDASRYPRRSNAPAPGSRRRCNVASTRFSSASAGPSSIWTASTRSPGTTSRSFGSVPVRAVPRVDVESAVRAVSQGDHLERHVEIGDPRPRRHSRWTRRPNSAARSHSAAKDAAASATPHSPPRTCVRVDRPRTEDRAYAEQIGLSEAEHVDRIELGWDGERGRPGGPPPRWVELRHGHAMIFEEGHEIRVADPS